LAVTFTDTSSNATAWSWDFGDGGTSDLKDPKHTFQTAKTYTVTLIARNSAGSSTPVTQTITVNAPTTTAPVASFTPIQASGSDPLTVNFTDTSTGDIKSWDWDFGDGSKTTVTAPNKADVSHIYQYGTNGAYTVSLTVTSTTNIQKTATGKITVNATQPQADFSATPTLTPLQMQFSDSSKGTVNQWAWQFGDGGTSTARNPAYTYKAASTYTVTLKATGPTGLWNTTTKSVTVSAVGASTSGLVAAYNFEEASGTTAFDASGQNNHGAITQATYTQGKYGNALNFDGVNDWVTVNDSATQGPLDLTKGMTVAAWVYPTATMSNWRSVLLKERAGGLAYGLYANSDSNQPVGSINIGGNDKNQAGGSALKANTWTHLAATYDGASATQRLYVNGTQVASRAQTGSLTVSDRVLRIGGNSVWSEFFKGHIDEVRVYNRALKAEEIQADMNTAGGRLLGSQQTSSYTDTISQYTAKAYRQKADKAGKVTNLSVYVTSGSTALVAGLYSDNNGRPGTLLAQGKLSSPKAGAWNAVPVPATAITAGTYWIAILSPGGILQVGNKVGGGSEPSITSPTTTATLPSPSWWTSGGTPSYDGPLAGYGTGY
jgi:PKD repeat protein